jgi:hypothetical protein
MVMRGDCCHGFVSSSSEAAAYSGLAAISTGALDAPSAKSSKGSTMDLDNNNRNDSDDDNKAS